ncbi:MAG TPA: biotin/lipoyl-binding protein [Xanthobacteraceae bacterium]|jgi:multidrug resistance efflux pump
MAALLLLGYAAICVVTFKLVRVPVNKWTVTTAGIGGVVIVGGLLALMNYNHPFTTDARLYFYPTPIVPEVKGRVFDVAVRPNVPLKRGDKLFSIDARPYQFVVDQKRAALAEAQQNVKELKATLDQATAAVEKRLKRGAQAEIAFDAIPGRVFTGKVNALIDAVSQGQLQTTGTLLNPEDRAKTPGLALVNISIVDDLSTSRWS